jgi:hypothetical protein
VNQDDKVVVLMASQLKPIWFVHSVLGCFAWSKQREIIESVRDNVRTAVRSCHGVGKTRVAAYVVLWFLESFPNSRVVTTAPTWTQVEELLWREIRAVFESARIPLHGKKFNTRLEVSDNWFAIGLSTDKPERFQGHHAEHILVVVDEGSGVDDAIYEAAEGYLTTPGARLLMIGNPTQTSGQFYQAFHRERHLWNLVHISAYDSPNFTNEEVPDDVRAKLVTQAWVEDKKIKWGEGTPMYDVRVLGNFPSQADNQVCALGDIEYAQTQVEYEPSPIDDGVIGCDVARFGSDETVISERHGKRIRIVETYNGRDTVETTGKILHHFKSLSTRCERKPKIAVDDDGVGGGVTDMLVAQGYHPVPFRGGASPVDPQEYNNARSELWFAFSDRLREFDLDSDEQLAADLSTPQYKMDIKGHRVVERKDEIKKRIGRSPDRADSVLLTIAPERGGVIKETQWTEVVGNGEPVRKTGDLILVGDKYVDKDNEW